MAHGVRAALAASLDHLVDPGAIDAQLREPRSHLLPDGVQRLRDSREDAAEDPGVEGFAANAEEDEVVEAALGELVDDLVAEPFRLVAAASDGRVLQPFQPAVDRVGPPLDQAVRVEDQRRSFRQEPAALGSAVPVIERDAERQAGATLQEVGLALRVDHERRRVTGQRVAQLSGLGLELDGGNRAEPRLLDLLRELVEPADQLWNALDHEPERSHRAAQLAHRGRRLDAVPDHVADRDQDAPVFAIDQVVPVAPDLELGGAGQVPPRRR